ncbi:zinc-ribbon domain-containing protein [candidate division WOR-3 bacterium]|nr:zinc-ribbon domain-containing protein [candidate division WOR-3 bacterium]
MVVECPKCKTKYEVADMDVPPQGGAVKCLECSNVFTIYRDPLDIKLVPFREDDFEPSVSEVKDIFRRNIEPEREAPVKASFSTQEETFLEEAVSEKVSMPEDPEKQRKHRKAERLGRSLVKDIYLYHKDKVEQGRRDGTLVQLLGEEIKKSWKFYKRQIDPEVLQERNYFKDALNEIIAEGKEVFK